MVARSIHAVGLAVLFAIAHPALSEAQGVPATAREHRVEINGGYQFLRFLGTGGEFNVPNGWLAGVSIPLNKAWSVVGETNRSFDTVDGHDYWMHSFLGGVRIGGGSESIRGFGELLTGVARTNSNDSLFVLEPGAGVDLNINRRFGVRVQGDFPLLDGGGNGNRAFRFGASGVIRLR